VNQSLTPLAVTDPVLRRRRAGEARYLAEVRRLATRTSLVPWMLEGAATTKRFELLGPSAVPTTEAP